MKKSILLVSLLMLFASATFAQADPKVITPPAGKSVIYIVRPSPTYGMFRLVNKIDDVELKTTGGTEFVYLIVDPGKHKIVCKGSTKPTELEVTTEAGQSIYVLQEVGYPPVGIGIYWCNLEVITDAKKIEKYMKKSDLAD